MSMLIYRRGRPVDGFASGHNLSRAEPLRASQRVRSNRQQEGRIMGEDIVRTDNVTGLRADAGYLQPSAQRAEKNRKCGESGRWQVRSVQLRSMVGAQNAASGPERSGAEAGGWIRSLQLRLASVAYTNHRVRFQPHAELVRCRLRCDDRRPVCLGSPPCPHQTSSYRPGDGLRRCRWGSGCSPASSAGRRRTSARFVPGSSSSHRFAARCEWRFVVV